MVNIAENWCGGALNRVIVLTFPVAFSTALPELNWVMLQALYI